MSAEFQQLHRNFNKSSWQSSSLLQSDALTCLEWSPDGEAAACGTLDGKVHVCAMEGPSPSISQTVQVCDRLSRITSVGFNKTGRLFAATSLEAKHVTLTDCDPGGHLGPPSDIACPDIPTFVSFMQDVANDQNLLLIGSRRGIRTVDVESGCVYRELHSKAGALAIRSWNGCMVAVSTKDRLVEIWDVRVREPVSAFCSGKSSSRLLFDVDRSGRVLAVSGDNGAVSVHDIGARKHITDLQLHFSPLRTLRFSHQMRFLVTSEADTLRITNLADFTHHSSKDMAMLKSVTNVRWHPSLCRWLKTRQVRFRTKTGEEGIWQSAHRTTKPAGCPVDGVDIIATLNKAGVKYFVFVKQYRIPMGGFCLEFPAGLIDAGESVEAAALRELKEETGYTATRVISKSSGMQGLDPGLTDDSIQFVQVEIDGDSAENAHPEQRLAGEESIDVVLVECAHVMRELRKMEKEVHIEAMVYSFALGYAMGEAGRQ